jgi:MFS family permease
MQRTADWIVLNELTHRNATAVGIVMGLQFGPQILLLPLSGFAADHLDRRKVLFCTQAAMGLLALGLGLLTVTGVVRLWHVYVFAFLLGCASAFDSPARQTFVAELVEERDLPNAVALNSTSFNVARMIGPAIAGGLIAGVGSGWVFLINALSFLAVLCSLSLLRTDRPKSGHRWPRKLGRRLSLRLAATGSEGDLAHAVSGRHLRIQFCDLHLDHVRHRISRRRRPVRTVDLDDGGGIGDGRADGSGAGEADHRGAATFGAGCALAALMPSYALFGLALFVVGVAAQTLTTSTNSLVQLSTEPGRRGRMIAILLAIRLGGTPIGAPIGGWVADHFGLRWALGVGAAAGLLAAAAGLAYLVKHRRPQADVSLGQG